jgi:hypothetical protein
MVTTKMHFALGARIRNSFRLDRPFLVMLLPGSLPDLFLLKPLLGRLIVLVDAALFADTLVLRAKFIIPLELDVARQTVYHHLVRGRVFPGNYDMSDCECHSQVGYKM